MGVASKLLTVATVVFIWCTATGGAIRISGKSQNVQHLADDARARNLSDHDNIAFGELNSKVARGRQLAQVEEVAMQFDNSGRADHIEVHGAFVNIRMDGTGEARARSVRSYPPGTTFTFQARCPAGDTSGMVSSVYLSSGEGEAGRDELDFEFVGAQKTSLQTNYWRASDPNAHVSVAQLGFDCSQNFQTYSIEYGWLSKWSINGAQVYAATGFTKSVYVYVVTWRGGDPFWAGKVSLANQPYYFVVQGITAATQG